MQSREGPEYALLVAAWPFDPDMRGRAALIAEWWGHDRAGLANVHAYAIAHLGDDLGRNVDLARGAVVLSEALCIIDRGGPSGS